MAMSDYTGLDDDDELKQRMKQKDYVFSSCAFYQDGRLVGKIPEATPSDVTVTFDDDELSRFRAHEADELDATLDRESEDGRDMGTFSALCGWPCLLSAG